jgi:hypothetical protein
MFKVSYKPNNGGHAPGHLRDAFCEAIELYIAWKDGPEPTVEYRDKRVPLSTICGLVWNCTDVLPSDSCAYLGDINPFAKGPQLGSSYGRAARLLKAAIRRMEQRRAA